MKVIKAVAFNGNTYYLPLDQNTEKTLSTLYENLCALWKTKHGGPAEKDTKPTIVTLYLIEKTQQEYAAIKVTEDSCTMFQESEAGDGRD